MKKNKLLILTLSTACLIGLASCQGAQGSKGDQGDPGINGTNGTDGKPGEDGKNGNTVLSGKGEPSSTLGSDGDSYIDSSTFDFYVKSNGAWSKQGNLKGNTGDQGNTGDTGDKGKDGSILLKGEGVPSDTLGKNGDSYIDTLTFDFYVKENDTWTKEGNIKGEKGDKGDKGDKGSNGSSGTNGTNGLDGTPAYGNTILSCENGYITVDVGSATVDSYVTFTMHPIDTTTTKYIGTSLSLINNGTTTTYEPDKADYKLEIDDNGLRYVKVKMKEGGFVVKGTFAEKQKHGISVTSNKIVNDDGATTDADESFTIVGDSESYYEGESVKITLTGKRVTNDSGTYKGKYALKSLKVGGKDINLETDSNFTKNGNNSSEDYSNVYYYTTKMDSTDLKVEAEWEYIGLCGLSFEKDSNSTGNGEVYVDYGNGTTGDLLDHAQTAWFDKNTNLTFYFKPSDSDKTATLKWIKIGDKTINVGDEGSGLTEITDDNAKGYKYKYTYKIIDALVDIQCHFESSTPSIVSTITSVEDLMRFNTDIRTNPSNYDGETITFNCSELDLSASENIWTPINLSGKTLTIIGNNTTIKNLTINGTGTVRFFSYIGYLNVSGLNFDKVTFNGNSYTYGGVLAGNTDRINISGCKVSNSTIGIYNNTTYAGALVGFLTQYNDTSKSSSMISNTVDSCTVWGFNCGGFIGRYGSSSDSISNLEFKKNKTTTQLKLYNYSTDTPRSYIGYVQDSVANSSLTGDDKNSAAGVEKYSQ